MATSQHTLAQEFRQAGHVQHRVGDFPDEVMQVSARLLQGNRDGLHSLNEAAPTLALGSKTRLSKNDGWPNRPLGDVVGWLDILCLDERPHRWLRSQNAAAHAWSFVAGAACPLVQKADHSHAELPGPALQLGAIDLIIAVESPQSEYTIQ